MLARNSAATTAVTTAKMKASAVEQGTMLIPPSRRRSRSEAWISPKNQRPAPCKSHACQFVLARSDPFSDSATQWRFVSSNGMEKRKRANCPNTTSPQATSSSQTPRTSALVTTTHTFAAANAPIPLRGTVRRTHPRPLEKIAFTMKKLSGGPFGTLERGVGR